MRRADRLFRIVEYLKARRHAVRAKDIAEEMEVNIRTVYRDIADLNASGVPIIGEAGVGYILDRDYILRPMMFNLDELDALALGAQMVASWSDEKLSSSAQSAFDKIRSLVPDQIREDMDRAALFSFESADRPALNVDFSSVRQAIRTRHYLNFNYINAQGEQTHRYIRPLALVFFAPIWLCLGWCETRQDFRNFRVDRMYALSISERRFRDEKGKRFQDYTP